MPAPAAVVRIGLVSMLLMPPLAAGQPQPAGTTFRDCAACPEMVAIPAGRFRMGAAAGEEDDERLADEFRHRSQPARDVRIGAFYAGRFEITVAEYRAFAQASGRSDAGCFAWQSGRHVLDQSRSWQLPGFAQGDDHPAVCISWQDALDYTRWLSELTGKRYRLPDEAEWEYAARAGTQTYRFWGDGADAVCTHANGADRSTLGAIADAAEWPAAACDDRYPYTAPVGRLRANAFGLHDMLGNAAEWTADCWQADYGGAPGAGDCALRAVRGGAWDEGPAGLRSAYRVGSPVTIRVYTRGFRVVRDP